MAFRITIILVLIQFALGTFAQKSDFLVKGIVLDATTGLPLDRVNISFFETEAKGTSSDSLGRFSLKITELPTRLKFTYIGYEETTIKVVSIKSKSLTIRLKPIIISLPEISVSAKRNIDTVFYEPINVVDYAFKGDVIILLIYKNVFEKYQLVTLNQNEKVIATLSLLDYRPSSLFTGCTENAYLNTDLGTYSISVDSFSIALSKRLDDEYFENVIRPCRLATDSFIYFSRHYYQGQALQYFGFARNNDDQKITFPLIQHVHNIDLLIEETGTRFPRSGNVWQTNVSFRLASLRDATYKLKGMMKNFYPALYAPMVQHDSLLCIFNHQESEMQFFTEDGTKVSSIPIRYHLLKKWNKELIFDPKNETIYTTFDTKWGNHICPIDRKTGTIGDAILIERDFIDKLKIHDGHLYFLYRNPYGGARNCMLQKMPID